MWKLFQRKGRKGVRLDSVSVNIPYVGSATFVPEESEVRAAWGLYVELATRVPIHPVDPNYGSLREALNSIYDLFQTMRMIVRDSSPRIAHGDQSLGPLAFGVLNNGLRPFLTKWHHELRVHESQRSPNKDTVQHKREWPKLNEFTAEMEELRANLERYARELLKIAGADMGGHDG